MKFGLFVVLYCIVFLLNGAKSEAVRENNNLIVELSCGKLKGKDNGYYLSYESIPYAKPPTGDLRFETPQPYREKWADIYDATIKPKACIQWNQFTADDYKLTGVEDCLFVNVFKPKTNKKTYPVLVFIHGGAFMFGSVNIYGEDILMKSGNMMLVTISYRLGPLGFLSTEDEFITGNFGLKDQQLALKWIKENIAHFGGDSEKIMLIGSSAGGASTHLQMLQPAPKNVVKVAVSLSGVALNPWVIIKNARKNAFKLAGHLKCPDITNSQEIKKCLKKKKAEEIVESVREFLNYGYNPFTTFGPVVEHQHAHNAFLTQHPIDIIKSGIFSHIPWLATVTAQDGGYVAAELLQINPETGKQFIDILNQKWLEYAPLNLFLQQVKSNPREYAQELRDLYLGNLPFSEENYLKVQEIYTDVLFKIGLHEAIKLHSHHAQSPVYSYVYDNPADSGVGQALSQRNDIEFGTVHTDDVTLILSIPTHQLRPDEQIISQNLIIMLENFVETGELIFDKCYFKNNAGKSDKLEVLHITRDHCNPIVVGH